MTIAFRLPGSKHREFQMRVTGEVHVPASRPDYFDDFAQFSAGETAGTVSLHLIRHVPEFLCMPGLKIRAANESW
jgi:hypothetical protein